MPRRKMALALGLFLVIGACTDTSGPPAGGLSPDRVTPEVAGTTIPNMLTQDDDAPVLETLQASVWVVKGEKQRIRIRYDAGSDEDKGNAPVLSFVQLEFDRNTLLSGPGGALLHDGDAVWVTVRVHPHKFRVTLEPSGLTFNADKPARLRVRYHNADPDLDHDGDVDVDDEQIRKDLLGLWLQEDGTGGWSRVLDVRHSLGSKKFDAKLLHFSDYAVAW